LQAGPVMAQDAHLLGAAAAREEQLGIRRGVRQLGDDLPVGDRSAWLAPLALGLLRTGDAYPAGRAEEVVRLDGVAVRAGSHGSAFGLVWDLVARLRRRIGTLTFGRGCTVGALSRSLGGGAGCG